MLGVARRLAGPATASFHTMAVRRAGPVPWNYLWKPGPVPRTEEARLAAAKKYGMIQEDYENYPVGSDEMCGDYPKLPLVYEAHKDPYYAWDYPEQRRDYNEPLHIDHDMYRETRYTPPDQFTKKTYRQMATMLGMVVAFWAFGFWIEKPENNGGWFPVKKQPVLEHKYQPRYKPFRTDYSFEPAE